MGMDSADLIDGLVVAVDVLHRRVGTKKYTKTIYLITTAEDKIGAFQPQTRTVLLLSMPAHRSSWRTCINLFLCNTQSPRTTCRRRCST